MKNCIEMTTETGKSNFPSLFGMVPAIVLAIAILGLPRGLQAQSSLGWLTGSVVDSSGAIVPDASVRVTNVSTNTTIVTKTTSDGIYSAPSLQPGEYTVTVDKPGFKTGSVTSVVVFASRESTANVALEVGSTSVKVTVAAEAPMISPNSAENSTTVESNIINNLPLGDVDVSYALGAVAGMTLDLNSTPYSQEPNAGTQVDLAAGGAQAGGGRIGGLAWLVDGSDDSLLAYAQEAMIFSAGDVQEISIVEGGVPAQYGRTTGGVINIATKGATNQYHGELIWRHRDPITEAWSFDSIYPPQGHANYFGIYAGGPVYIPKVYDGKDKTWFYVGVEPYRTSALSPTLVREYTADELAGNFYNAYSIINTTVLAQSGAAAALAAARTGGFYYHFPLNSAGFPIGVPYNSATQYVPIPAGGPQNLPYYLGGTLAANPMASYFVPFIPSPQNPGPYISFLYPTGLWNNNGNSAYRSTGAVDANNQYGIRLDHNFGANDHLFGRWYWQDLTGAREADVPNTAPYVTEISDWQNTRNISLNEVHTISSQMVNEFRATLMHSYFLRAPNAPALTKDWGPTLPFPLFPASSGKGYPVIALGDGSFNALGSTSPPLHDNDQTFGVGDDLTWTRGRHIIRFGADIRRYQENYANLANTFGDQYSFGGTNNGTSGGENLAAFDLGELTGMKAVPVPVPEYYRWHYYAGYAQDDIKVTRKLTANLGLRWEFETPRMEKYDRQGTFVSNLAGTLNGVAVTGAFCFSGNCGLPTTLWPSNYHGFEPRVGLAYALTPKWVWRASYDIMRAPLTGIFGYGNFPDLDIQSGTIGGQYGGTNPNAWTNMITNPPIQPTGGYPVLGGGPYFTMDQGGAQATVPYVPQSSVVPYVQTWQLSTQYQLARNDMIEVDYVGNHGAHLTGTDNAVGGHGPTGSLYNKALNVPPLAQLIALGEANTNWTIASNTSSLGLKTSTGSVLGESVFQSYAPYQGFFYDNIYEYGNRDYDSDYNALWLTWSHRTGHGLYLQSSFTWEKEIDDSPNADIAASNYGSGSGTNNGVVQNPWNLHGERAEALSDMPWRLAVQYAYELPVGQGKAFAVHNWVLNDIIGNWLWSGYFTDRSGQLASISTGNNGYFFSVSPTNGNYGNYLPEAYSIRPNVVPGQPLVNKNWRQDPTHIPYFNTAAFTMPGSIDAPALGDAPRTFCCSPALWTWDMGLQKHIPLGKNEHRYFDLEARATDVFNHPTFYNNPNSPTTLLSSFNFSSITNSAVPAFTQNGSFGLLSASTCCRSLLLVLRLVW